MALIIIAVTLIAGCTKVVDYFSGEPEPIVAPEPPAKLAVRNETPAPAPACDLCPTDTVYYRDGKICSDANCTCSDKVPYACSIDENLYVQFRIDNAGDKEMQYVTPKLFCTKNGIYIETFGGLWLLIDQKDITFPKQRTFVSRMFPGGFVVFNFEFKIADFSADNVFSCKYDVSAKIDGQEQAIDHREFSFDLSK